MNIAIFASGNGSNFQALVDDAFIKPHVKLLVCDKPNAYVLERANTHQIPVFLFEAKNYPDKEAFETEILLELRGLEIDLLVLAGYMRLIGPTLLAEFPSKLSTCTHRCYLNSKEKMQLVKRFKRMFQKLVSRRTLWMREWILDQLLIK